MVAYPGGRGRKGTALAFLAVLDGAAVQDVVAFVRQGFEPRAIEMPWRRRFAARLPSCLRVGCLRGIRGAAKTAVVANAWPYQHDRLIEDQAVRAARNTGSRALARSTRWVRIPSRSERSRSVPSPRIGMNDAGSSQPPLTWAPWTKKSGS